MKKLLLLIALFTVPHFASAVTCGYGTEVGASGMCRGFITATTTTTWSVPSDWNNASNTIEVIGGGGAGSIGLSGAGFYSQGAGGGAYSKEINATLTGGSTVGIQVGDSGWTKEDGDDTWVCNSTSNCASIAGSAVIVGAKAGRYDTSAGFSAGGAAASGVGDVKYSGGDSYSSDAFNGGGGGGGGAGGPNGDGADGGTLGATSNGSGGGGAGGGSAGDSPASDGGAGGNNYLGSGGGTLGGGFQHAGDGSNGGGGGGMDNIGFSAGDGGNGTEWTTAGAGGGGGGSGGAGQIELNSSYNTCFGGVGGLYGGGGGGCGGNGARDGYAYRGGQGIIVISYNPSAGGGGESVVTIIPRMFVNAGKFLINLGKLILP